ncbi:PREDICTED: selenocysteine insertion sequence-binding protein 2 isoform X2 [Thamnophis sirtalis]|uniref:Selenocysteine insertion sequence-binding protein 2 isoform X2 n=1 Tax=Thamnophis sirtalis TaxID=35019 RepID=A0A6I9XNA2_9SAUR|nr:PREDICTED: selenocysteine insertion sequence-binding protein 2 isoform X2 [Thamnophis sirtalis]
MTSERGAGNEGIKLSAEVKPFVPKFAAVTVAWPEPSEACVFPGYYTTCYPYVQEPSVNKQQLYIEEVPWDTSTCLSQCAPQNITGCTSLEEYTNSPYSLTATPRTHAVSSFQSQNISSKQGREYTPPPSLIRKECATLSRRQLKNNETRLEDKRPNRSDFTCRSTENSAYIPLHSRNTIKSGTLTHMIEKKEARIHNRPIKVMNGKFKQIPNAEHLPEPAFEMTLSDFPKLQDLESNNLLDLQKHAWGPVVSAEGDKLPLTPPGKLAISNITKEGEVCWKKHFTTRPLSSSSDPGVPQANPGLFTEIPLSWATVLSQTSKKVVPVPASILASNHSGSKKTDNAPEDYKKSERENASNLEETAKRKKKKKKKKKARPCSEVEKLPIQRILVQDPPRIQDVEEFPDLASAFDRKHKQATENIPCLTPIIEKTKIITKLSFESHDHSPPKELIPMPDVLSTRKTGKQDPPAPIEKKKMQDTLPSKKNRKKSQIPVQLDLGGMLAVLEEKQHAEKLKQSFKPLVLSVGSGVTLSTKESPRMTKTSSSIQKNTPHNPLDSSSPLVKKGKQREVPKPKKPTSLKKIILKEREQRKQQHVLEQMATPKKADAVEQNAESVPDDEQFCKAPKEGAGFMDNQSGPEVVKEVAEYPVLLTPSNSEVDLKCTESSGSMQNSIDPSQLKSNFPKIHSRRFRDYCTQVLSKEVDSCVTDLLKELVRFQDRLYQKDPVKAKTKRRLVLGLREVLKHLKLKKLKCVIISPNCEKIQSKGGLDETLHLIIDTACEQNIPFVFALNRKALGHCVNKLVPVSVVGIFSYDGAQDYFHKMVELTMEARLAYKEMISTLEKESSEDVKQSDCVLQTDREENCALDNGMVPFQESEEDAPNYIKIWKQKLEEEYNPYILELEKLSTTDMLPLGVEEPQ